jgi:two-component system osmolarity sensor histidine kinase EnvZ
MLPKRIDSLFARLLLAQLVLVASALLVFGALLAIERNQLVAPHMARLYAPYITAAVRAPQADALPEDVLQTGIQRHEGPPSGFKLKVSDMPAVQLFTQELNKYGVHLEDTYLERRQGQLILWSRVHVPGAAPVWLSGPIPSPLPAWATRMTVGLAVLGLVIALVSWTFSRRVTQPLEQLQRRMQTHASTGIQPADLVQTPHSNKGPPELIEIDKAYRLLAERLERNERERALLLAGVSHDLRSPLSRIRLAAEMLPELPDNAAGVASITRNVDHADRLTASFLEFVRAGAVELNETVNLAAAVRRVVAEFDHAGDQLSAQTPGSVLLQRAHGLLIERLIANLIDNALKHGGAPVEVVVVQSGEVALLTVSDAGPGLPQESAAHLMEAFARGDASRSVPGFGLGLTIAQRIVVRLQGELSFVQTGRRHQVTARLPLQR